MACAQLVRIVWLSGVLWGFLELLVIGNATPLKNAKHVCNVVRLFASSY